MGLTRRCTKSGCTETAAATLTYVYADSTVVLGPLSTAREPHSYDLCSQHANNLTAPLGWQVVRLASEFVAAPPSEDDLLALANAVREAVNVRPRTSRSSNRPVLPSQGDGARGNQSGRRGYLRVLPGQGDMGA